MFKAQRIIKMTVFYNTLQLKTVNSCEHSKINFKTSQKACFVYIKTQSF